MTQRSRRAADGLWACGRRGRARGRAAGTPTRVRRVRLRAERARAYRELRARAFDVFDDGVEDGNAGAQQTQQRG
jgi:hypothetical protein